MIRFFLAVCGFGVVALPVVAAPPVDIATVFPADTLAYAEVSNPAELGPHLAAAFKGTPLEDSVSFIESKRGAAKTLPELNTKRELAELALFASPEVFAELRKLGGVAVGLTGFNDRGEPELVVAVLTGDSAAAGLAARAFLTTSTGLRKVADVSKVAVFQSRPPVVRYDMNGNPKLVTDKPPTEGGYEPTFAYTPGLFVAGTSKAALAPVIKRFLGAEKDALAGTAGFKSAAAGYRKPGLFFYANAPQLVAKMDAAGRDRGAPFDFELFALLKLTANAKALKTVAGTVQFRNGGAALTVGVQLDPAQRSPLAAVLAGPPVKGDALHHARRPVAFAATVNMPERNRAAALLGVLDAGAKASGDLGRLPSEAVKELEERYKTSIADGLLEKVRAVTVIVPRKQDLPKGAKSLPVVVLHLNDAAAATAWEEFLPKLVADLAGEKTPAEPSSETVAGVKVLSLPATGLPWKAGVHFARRDAVLVAGLDRKLVGAAAAGEPAAAVTGGDKPLAVPAGEYVLLGGLDLGDLISAVLPAPGDAARSPEPPRRIRRGENPAPPDEVRKELDKARGAFLAAFGELPPAVVTVRRSGAELRLDVFQPKVQGGGLAPVISAGVSWFDTLMSSHDPNSDFPRGHNMYGNW
ncbi:hypothetical protein [Frigoriglobus tundricola]|uniref:DUF3352 domain-containing protein n=1 Tax=Frigoriglobus tundricola TaxID=2774151 RepID=A0A6M5YJP8_9BACT|nr:hypothetical protein [Frigoriglobus tundricola]QJW93493.1 hypothetical protein FTUN_0999 [Frigoriglobus tundricola]